MEYVSIQAQISGLWRTYNNVFNNSQRILAAMKELQSQFPTCRVRAIDFNGKLVDIL